MILRVFREKSDRENFIQITGEDSLLRSFTVRVSYVLYWSYYKAYSESKYRFAVKKN